MHLIVGLGNPGTNYEKTRHNIGFIAANYLQDQRNLNTFSLEKKRNSQVTKGKYRNDDLIIIKPLTYMNRSGGPIQQISHYYKIPPENIILIHDEIDFPFAKVKIKDGGGHGGHNGLRDTIQKLGTNTFKRIRIGVDRPSNPQDVSNYVLSNFSSNEQQQLKDILITVQEKVEHLIAQ